MFDKKTYTPIKSACISLASTMLLTGCISENSPCPVDTDERKDGVTLQFSLVTRNATAPGTRALEDPAGTPIRGTVEENFLDLDNLTFLLFDNEQNLIRAFRPNVEVEDATYYVKYSVKAEIFDAYFINATEDELTFSIGVIGNYSYLEPTAGFVFHEGQSMSEIFNSSNVATFAMPTSSNGDNCWIPSIHGTQYTDALGKEISGMQPAYIPMSGLQTYTVKTEDLRKSTLNDPLKLSIAEDGSQDINMLRALAKIEVVDRLALLEYDTHTEIKKVELIGHTTKGAIFPTLGQWHKNNIYETQYVSATSIPASASYVGVSPNGDNLNIDNTADAIVSFFADAAATTALNDGSRVFSCYLTEYNPLSIGDSEPMWIRLTCESPGVGGGNPTTSLYRLNVAPYTDNNPGVNMAILRNNIYRYEITGITMDLELKLIVNDWLEQTTTWEYSDNPGLAADGYLRWQSEQLDLIEENAEIYYSYPLTGTFTLAEPKGGFWTASFMPLTQTTNPESFMFVDEEGNMVSTISGEITGTESQIKVVAQFEPGDEDRKVRLVFTVETPVDHRVIPADLLGGYYGDDNKYFTIIQNAKE